MPGITLFMQPVQDISVEDRVSRTEFQYTLEDANADELNRLAPQMVEKLKQLPELRDVASDQEVLGLRATLVFDRETAYRLGITPSEIDQTLYDAYGQRQVSTMFTQLNQYHVVLEVQPGFEKTPLNLRDLYIRTGWGHPPRLPGLVSGGSAATQTYGPRRLRRPHWRVASTASSALNSTIASASVFGVAPQSSIGICEQRSGAAQRFHPPGDDQRAHYRKPSGAVPGDYAVLQSGAGRLAGRRRERREQGEGPDEHAGQRAGGFSGHGGGISGVPGERAGVDSGGAGDGLYRTGGVVRELYPSHHDSFDAAFGGCRRAAVSLVCSTRISA